MPGPEPTVADQQHMSSIRISRAKLVGLLERLDAQQGTAAWEGRARYHYRVPEVRLALQLSAGAAPVLLACPTRWISERAVSLLHGGFVYKGTPASVQLVTRIGTWRTVNGDVHTCRYADGAIHEVVVQFSPAVDPTHFTANASELKATVICNDPLTAGLLRALLEQQNARVMTLPELSADFADDAASKSGVVFVMLRAADDPRIETLRKLRESNFSGVIVAVSADGTPEAREMFFSSGADYFLQMPFTREDFERLTASLGDEPVLSNYQDEPAFQTVLQQYMSELPNMTQGLRDGISANDASAVRNVTREIRVHAIMCGFDIVGQTAMRIESMLDHGKSICELRSDFNQLTRWCGRVIESCRRSAESRTSYMLRQPSEVSS